MSKIFVISDTWFNRIMSNEQYTNVVDKNNDIISNWNDIVKKDDKVYVLGGFGISDLYHIVCRLNGEIHFLNNFYNSDEKNFFDDLCKEIDKSSDVFLKERIIFEENQIMILNEIDTILSYFPLNDWCGKDTGTYCFHGLNSFMDINGHNISCVSWNWNYHPLSIEKIQSEIKEFKEKV